MIEMTKKNTYSDFRTMISLYTDFFGYVTWVGGKAGFAFFGWMGGLTFGGMRFARFFCGMAGYNFKRCHLKKIQFLAGCGMAGF